jgi:hypothetical protein
VLDRAVNLAVEFRLTDALPTLSTDMVTWTSGRCGDAFA